MNAGASYIAKHSSSLTLVSLELWETSEDIWTLMPATLTCYMPQLQQFVIKMSPKWAASVGIATVLPFQSQSSKLHADQLSATKACLRLLGRKAPNLRALSMIDDGILRTLPLGFSKLKHLVLDCRDSIFDGTWVPELPQLKTLRVNVPTLRQWSVDLRAMTSLEYFSVTRHVTEALQLPKARQVHMGELTLLQTSFLKADIAPWLPQLTRMEVALEASVSQYVDKWLDLDLHLDDLTLRFHDIGHDRKSFQSAISAESCPILRQAKHVSLYARDISIQIASDATLAWRKVRMIAERQLTLKYSKPEVLLEGRSAIVLRFSRTNILNASVMWRPIAKRLGLSFTTSESSSNSNYNDVTHTLCLSTGSAEDHKFLRAPCVCHACMECLVYYDMLK